MNGNEDAKEQEKKEDLKKQFWRDYVEKGNSFANWFTSILISNFVYLVRIGETVKLDWSGKISFGFSVLSLVAMFLFKAVGVYTAKERHSLLSQGREPDNCCIHMVETLRTKLFYLFVGSGIFAVIFSGFILWVKLTK